MESIESMKKGRIPFNLQFFADEGGDGGEDNDDGRGGGTPTFDEMLQSGYQVEFDERIQNAVDSAVKEAQEKWKVLTDDQVSEAEKLAKMNAQEKKDYMQQKKEKELNDREAALTKKELMATAKNTLTEKGMPLELAEVLNYKDAEACNHSIATVEKAFQSAVEKAVDERLKGDKPPRRSGNTDGETTDAVGFVGIIKENQSKR